MNNKNYFIFAAAIALASCSVDEYMGENPEFTQTTKENIIGFGGGTGSMSRATSNDGTTEVMLDKHFKVYGCKSTTTSGTYQRVFDNYWVWYETNTSSSTSNSKNWEYVGDINKPIYGNDANTPVGTLQKAQYIKYWDYSADHYHFVAGTPQIQVDFTTDNTTKDVTGATIKNLAGHINPNPTGGSGAEIKPNPVYLAKPVVIKKSENKYRQPVKFDFVRLQSKVRVGIYETIPGYSIESIEFYNHDGNNPEAKKHNVTLYSARADYFNGGSNVKATVNYDWTGANAPTYSITYGNGDETNNSGHESSQNWYGGKFANGIPAQSSIPSGDNKIEKLYGTDNDMDASTGYFTVLPTETGTLPSALTIKCDFTLKSDDGSGETINVKGATAAIPAEYCKWGDNKMYTYIFKISQETNGTTGTGNDLEGLFPITFDATAEVIEDGTETIVQTPSITTYQAGSVTDNGIQYVANKQIDITVMQDGELKTLNQSTSPSIGEGYIAVYKLSGEKTTEADLTVSAPTDTNAKQTLTLSIVGTDPDKKASFKPSDAGTYAIQYHNVSAYFYKVIEVKAASGS